MSLLKFTFLRDAVHLQVGFQCAASLRVKYRCCVLRHLNQCHSLHPHVLLVASFHKLVYCVATKHAQEKTCAIISLIFV